MKIETFTALNVACITIEVHRLPVALVGVAEPQREHKDRRKHPRRMNERKHDRRGNDRRPARRRRRRFRRPVRTEHAPEAGKKERLNVAAKEHLLEGRRRTMAEIQMSPRIHGSAPAPRSVSNSSCACGCSTCRRCQSQSVAAVAANVIGMTSRLPTIPRAIPRPMHARSNPSRVKPPGLPHRFPTTSAAMPATQPITPRNTFCSGVYSACSCVAELVVAVVGVDCAGGLGGTMKITGTIIHAASAAKVTARSGRGDAPPSRSRPTMLRARNIPAIPAATSAAAPSRRIAVSIGEIDMMRIGRKVSRPSARTIVRSPHPREFRASARDAIQ